jgi:hypothetical protein
VICVHVTVCVSMVCVCVRVFVIYTCDCVYDMYSCDCVFVICMHVCVICVHVTVCIYGICVCVICVHVAVYVCGIHRLQHKYGVQRTSRRNWLSYSSSPEASTLKSGILSALCLFLILFQLIDHLGRTFKKLHLMFYPFCYP